jgi:hypothetical protein
MAYRSVAGAYGHSRLREWVMGGVTRNLLHWVNEQLGRGCNPTLLDSEHYVLASH